MQRHEAAFLGVDHSLNEWRWVGPDNERNRRSEALAQQTDLRPAVASVLARSNVNAEEALAYLDPKLRDLLPNPRSMKDAEKAAARLILAIEKKQRIAIFADYDVDGACSAAQLQIWCREFGRETTLYIPDRIDEGYGPNRPAMEQLAAHHDLIICVDCGTLSFDPIAAVRDTDVLILDHHLGAETLPDAYAIVNPNRQDEDGALSHLCAAAVVFLVLVETRRQLSAEGKTAPDLMALLDLVALATIADVAPLIGVNRAFVQQGLRVMAGRNRPGLVALADIAGLTTAPTAYHLGFVLGPRINAGGRVGQADLGARLLRSASLQEAMPLASALDGFNTERRQIEAAVRDEALSQAEARAERSTTAPLLSWAAGEDWHPGIVGIVASRMKEATRRPSIVIGTKDGIGKGSGRSIPGVDLGHAIQRLAQEGLLIAGGGHKMAAGLTVEEKQIPHAMARLSELISKQASILEGAKDFPIDGMLTPDACDLELLDALDRAGPFGPSAPAPRFAFAGMQIHFAKPVGETHLKLSFGVPGGTRMDAIAFGAFEGPIGPALREGIGGVFHLIGRLDRNTFRGRTSVQLILEDAAPV